MSSLLFVIQRYGREVAGGAELLGREFATRLAARGHRVEVVTSCALSYVDWANHYPAGHGRDRRGDRPPPAGRRAAATTQLFTPLNTRVAWGHKPHAAVPGARLDAGPGAVSPRARALAAGAGAGSRRRQLLHLPLLPDVGRAAGGRLGRADDPAPDRPRRATAVPRPVPHDVPPPLGLRVPHRGGGGAGRAALPARPPVRGRRRRHRRRPPRRLRRRRLPGAVRASATGPTSSSSAGSTRPRGRRSCSTSSPPTSSATPGPWPWPSSATPSARSTPIPTSS